MKKLIVVSLLAAIVLLGRGFFVPTYARVPQAT
jgi:hypothetical protein